MLAKAWLLAGTDVEGKLFLLTLISWFTDYKFLRYKAVHRTDPVPEVLDGLAASHTNALAFVAMSMYGEASHPSVAHPIHATNV